MVNVLAGSGLELPPATQPTILAGYVSTSQPAPQSFDDPVYVVVPTHSTERMYGPVQWPAIHGTALPVKGSPTWLAIDDNGAPVVVWWGALYGPPPPPLSLPPAAFIAGSGPPTDAVGSPGAIYLDYANLRIWGPKAGSWPSEPLGAVLPIGATWADMP